MKESVPTNSLYTGYAHLAAGICCGLCCLGSGIAIGVAGEASVKCCGLFDHELKKAAKRPGMWGNTRCSKRDKTKGGGDKLFVTMVLIQVFAGNLALYGLITSIILSQMNYVCSDYQ
jgi:V-type H+-transporting ATPase proteolipid subunit